MPQAHALFMVQLVAPLYWEGSFWYTLLFIAWIPKLILPHSSEMIWNLQIVSDWRVLVAVKSEGIAYAVLCVDSSEQSYPFMQVFVIRLCIFLLLFRHVRVWKATVSFIMSFRLPVRMEQLGSHSTDFNEIRCLRILLKSVGKIQVSLKSDNNNVYFKWRPEDIFYYVSFISS
jgi:hypothetical protein